MRVLVTASVSLFCIGIVTTTANADFDGEIASGANRARAKFDQVYTETGIAGVIDDLEHCYAAARKTPSVTKLAECGAMDIIAANVDGSASQRFNMPPQTFFSEKKIDQRLGTVIKKLKLTPAQRSNFGTTVLRKIEGSN